MEKRTEGDADNSLYVSPTRESDRIKELVCEAIRQLELLWFVNARTGT
jgi:hypothetical protein